MSDVNRPGIHVRQPPKKMTSRTSKIAMASERRKNEKAGAMAIFRERRQERKKTGSRGAPFSGERVVRARNRGSSDGAKERKRQKRR